MLIVCKLIIAKSNVHLGKNHQSQNNQNHEKKSTNKEKQFKLSVIISFAFILDEILTLSKLTPRKL